MNVVKTVLIENRVFLFSCLEEREVTNDFEVGV